MKSYGVNIQMKPLQEYFQIVVLYTLPALNFESVDEIRETIEMKSLQLYSDIVLFS